MKKAEGLSQAPDNVRLRRAIDFVDVIDHREDAELAYYSLVLSDEVLPPPSTLKLIQVLNDPENSQGDEFAFRTLRDLPALSSELRASLLNRIVQSADKTTCSLTLQHVSNLGVWDQRLRNVLSGQ